LQGEVVARQNEPAMSTRETLPQAKGVRKADAPAAASGPGTGARSPADAILSLQKTAGNRAVTTLLARQATPSSVGTPRVARGQVHRAGDKPGTTVTRRAKYTVLRVTVYVDLNQVVLELDHDKALSLPLDHNGLPKPGSYTATYDDARHRLVQPNMGGHADDKGFVVKWTVPPGIILTYRSSLIIRVMAGRPGRGAGDGGSGGGAETGGTTTGTGAEGGAATPSGSETGGAAAGSGADAGTTGATGGAGGAGAGGSGKDAETGSGAGDTGEHAGGSDAGDPAATRMTASEEEFWRDLYQKTVGSPPGRPEDLVEEIRLYEILRSKVEDPSFSRTGSPWAQFARFLEENKDKIEGILRSRQGGPRLTEEKIRQIIAEYGKFVAAIPSKDEDRTELKSFDDFDKEFKYDPGWAQLSPQDRKLLVEYARKSPEATKGSKVDFTRVTTSMKVVMALKLSWKSWPGEIAEAAKEAFSDPTFIVTLVALMVVYVGLWLTPDPTMVTKILAGALTVALLLQFAWEDIYGFAKAFSELFDACAAASDINEIEAAGDRFAKKVGQVGFDIILFIVMHRIGKRLGPRVQKVGADRLVESAREGVSKAEAQPGSGAEVKAPSGAPDVLNAAKAKASAQTPAAILDALATELPEGSRQGLARMRSGAGDAQTLKALESQQAKGSDLGRYLEERGMTKAAQQGAQLDLLKAKTRLARAELIKADTFKDPVLRETAKRQAYRRLAETFADYGLLDDPAVAEKAKARAVKELAGVLGEAIQRAQLKIEFPEPDYKILSNIAVAREVPGFKRIADWKAAEAKAGRPNAKTANLVEHDGMVWRLLGEFDALIVQDTAGGKLRLIAGEEVKTGGDSPAEALGQVEKAIDAVRQISQGATDIAVFERPAPQQFGAEITQQLDVSSADTMAKLSRGPAGTGHPSSLPYDTNVLTGVAESIVRDGIPPKNPQPVVTPARRREELDPVPAGP